MSDTYLGCSSRRPEEAYPVVFDPPVTASLTIAAPAMCCGGGIRSGVVFVLILLSRGSAIARHAASGEVHKVRMTREMRRAVTRRLENPVVLSPVVGTKRD